MLLLDGFYGEGGGQILRSALSLSLLTGKAFRLENIRARRPRPGLRPQHLTCVKAAAKLSKAEVEGATRGSLSLFFKPRGLQSGAFTFDIGTAGAVGLLFQSLYLPLAAAGGGRLILKGGTHVPYSPCFHYLAEVFWPLVSRLGLSGSLELRRYGFYPAGGGEMWAEVAPLKKLEGLDIPPPFKPPRTYILSVVSSQLPDHIRRRQAQRAESLLKERGLSLEIRLEKAESLSPGTVLGVWGSDPPRQAGAFALGARGKPAERVAEEAVWPYLEIMAQGASVDEHLADQILLPAALAQGRTRFLTPRISRHLLTNAWVIKQFLPEVQIEIRGQEGEPGEVQIHGTAAF